jgi:hypothetical protein
MKTTLAAIAAAGALLFLATLSTATALPAKLSLSTQASHSDVVQVRRWRRFYRPYAYYGPSYYYRPYYYRPYRYYGAYGYPYYRPYRYYGYGPYFGRRRFGFGIGF